MCLVFPLMQMLCPVGRYSLGGPTITCSACPTGYYCPARVPAPIICPLGTFSLGGVASCTPCSAGTYGASQGLQSSACSGPCPAGYRCSLGATNGTGSACPAGTYSMGGSATCSMCPVGRFGSTSALTSSSCTGACTVPGFYCPAGSSRPSATPCPAGTYGPNGTCVVCPAASPYSAEGSTASANCTSCTGGSCTGWVGVYPCPSMGWTPWVDSLGVEGNNSCIAVDPAVSTWSAASTACTSMASGAHLLTTQQVETD